MPGLGSWGVATLACIVALLLVLLLPPSKVYLGLSSAHDLQPPRRRALPPLVAAPDSRC